MSEVAESIQTLGLTGPALRMSGGHPVVPTPSTPAITGTAERPAERGSSALQTGKRFGIRFALLSVMSILILGFVLRFWLSLWAPSGMVLIPGGEFNMGSDPSDLRATPEWAKRIGCTECTEELYAREQPLRQVQVSAFYLDKTEVTNDQYAAWLNRQADLEHSWDRRVMRGSVLLIDLWAGVGYAGIRFNNNRYEARRGLEKRPVAQVTWDGALRYCEAQGKRLPTEAEGEYAARGKDGFRFPWGDDEPRCDGVIFDGSATVSFQAHVLLGIHPADDDFETFPCPLPISPAHAKRSVADTGGW